MLFLTFYQYRICYSTTFSEFSFRFCVFMHDKTKQMFIDEHDGNAANQNTIRAISVPGYEFIPHAVGKRFIKTHLPFSLMPPSVMNERAKMYVEFFDISYNMANHRFHSYGAYIFQYLCSSESQRCDCIILSFITFVSDHGLCE